MHAPAGAFNDFLDGPAAADAPEFLERVRSPAAANRRRESPVRAGTRGTRPRRAPAGSPFFLIALFPLGLL